MWWTALKMNGKRSLEMVVRKNENVRSVGKQNCNAGDKKLIPGRIGVNSGLIRRKFVDSVEPNAKTSERLDEAKAQTNERSFTFMLCLICEFISHHQMQEL